MAVNSLRESKGVSNPAGLAFIAGVAHDLKTPLATIATSAELLEQDVDVATSDHLVEIIQRQAHQMQLIVQDLSDYFRMADKVLLHPGVVDVSAVVTETCSAVQQIETAHSLNVMLPASPILIHLDEAKLRRILENLLRNAAKHTPTGSTILARVRLLTSVEPGIVLEVEDDGPGIPAKERERVFAAFVRLGRSRCEGQGLGLQIVKQLAEAQGGSAWVEDGATGGARFCVKLPDSRTMFLAGS